MKVFMSWSGPRSHAVAQLLGDWLQNVIQAVKPWISSAGIERGELWFRKISDNLGEVNMGIVCLTPENRDAPWILFEAGALLKGIPAARVMTFLIDLKTSDIRDPLAQFNHTLPTQSDMYKLVETLNSKLAEPLNTERLKAAFENYWPQFEKSFTEIMSTYQPAEKVVERPQAEILSEVLEAVRGLQKQMRILPPSSLPMMGGRGARSLAAETLLGRASREYLEDYVSQGIRANHTLEEIIAHAEAGGLPQTIGLADRVVEAYNEITGVPRFNFGNPIRRLYGGGEATEIPLKNPPSVNPPESNPKSK